MQHSYRRHCPTETMDCRQRSEPCCNKEIRNRQLLQAEQHQQPGIQQNKRQVVQDKLHCSPLVATLSATAALHTRRTDKTRRDDLPQGRGKRIDKHIPTTLRRKISHRTNATHRRLQRQRHRIDEQKQHFVLQFSHGGRVEKTVEPQSGQSG